ncbi:PAS domain S-box protein [Melioribacter sp. Ez-97]|uniref:PAS domain S-box protein n=1 Tax=Melioribacter sp. Ez-97 TaxID=3423434 RepID=UPI003EDA6C1E
MIITDLIYNLALLISVSVLSGYAEPYFPRNTLTGKIIQGFVFGIAAVTGIIFSYNLSDGIFIDGASIIPGVAALFFGYISGLIAALAAIIYRTSLGGIGVYTSALIILTSLAIGLIFRRYARARAKDLNALHFYIMGLIIHFAMLSYLLLLPDIVTETYESAAITIITLFPAATVLICTILSDQLNRYKSADKLKAREELFRTALYSIGEAVITTDAKGLIKSMNSVAENLTGWNEKDSLGLPVDKVFNIVNEFTGKKSRNPVELALEENKTVAFANHTLLINRNGDKIPIADSGAPIKNDSGEITGVVLVFRDQTQERETENRINETNHILQNILDTAPVSIFWKNTDSVYIGCNKAFALQAGFDYPSEIYGKNDHDLKWHKEANKIIGDDKEVIMNDINNIGKIEKFSLQDGTVKWHRINRVPLKNSLGEITGILGVMEDITDQKLLEEKLAIDEDRLRMLVEGTPDFFFYTQDAEGNLTYVSPSVERITGYNFEEWFAKRDWFTTDNPINKLAKEITVMHLKGLQTEEPIYIEIKNKSGELIFLEIYEHPIIRNGKVAGLQGVAHNITKEREFHEKLKTSEAELQAIFDALPDVVFTINNEGRYLKISSSNQELLYKPADNLLNRTLHEVLPVQTADYFLQIIHNVLEDKKGGQIEYELEINNELKNFLATIEPLTSDTVLWVARDITLIKNYHKELIEAKESAEKADKLKSEFLAQMSHEIRSPINNILGHISLVKMFIEENSYMDEDLNFSFDAIDNSSRRIVRTIDSILNMSELSLGTYKPNKKKIDILAIVENLYNEYKSAAARKNLQFNVNNNADFSLIYSDDYSVYQIIANLIDNAIKYTKEGGIAITLNNLDDVLEVKISDTGIGISEEYQKSLFTAFSQEEHGYTRKFEGTGLGMSLVKRYCDLIGAGIEVESKKKVGTTFTLTFPQNINLN